MEVHTGVLLEQHVYYGTEHEQPRLKYTLLFYWNSMSTMEQNMSNRDGSTLLFYGTACLLWNRT